MFSKEWKLAALALAAVSCLTACPQHKKKANGVPFQGLWINAEADQELTRFANSGDRVICEVVMSDPVRFGISMGFDGEVSLDAWAINSSGDVFQYTSPARASTLGTGYKERYYMGRVNSTGEFTHKNASLGIALAPRPSRNNCYQAPFARGNADVQLTGSTLNVLDSNYRLDWRNQGNLDPAYAASTTYVRVTDKNKLRRLSHALSACTQLATVARTCYGYSRVAPVAPNQMAPVGPAVGPDGFAK